MDDIKKIYSKLEEQEKRIHNLEKIVGFQTEHIQKHTPTQTTNELPDPIEYSKEKHHTRIKNKPLTPSLTFTQIITFLGVLGVIIGLVSFFLYAIANHWIGESAQILIGILIGATLFGFAYKLHEKRPMWSMFVFGGSLLTEFITIGIGVLEYEVLPKTLGFAILTIFICISIALSTKFNSRIIAYYSLVGGYMIPLISGLYNNDLFIISYLLLLSLGLLILSSKYNWADLRFISSIIQIIYISSNLHTLTRPENLTIALTFIILNFLLYNFATLIYAIRNKQNINQLDAITMNFNSIFFLIFSYAILDNVITSMIEFGIYILPLSFLYLGQIYYLKSTSKTDYKTTYYSIFSSAIITLNLSIYFILESFNIDFFIILFAIEWFLFALLSKDSQDKKYLQTISYIFLTLFGLWYYYIVDFQEGMLHASLYMIFYIIVIGLMAILLKKNINKEINGSIFLIYIFIVIYSLSKYTWYFGFTEKLMSLSLSIMWLAYTLIGIKLLSKHKGPKALLMILLSITLLKIAFIDLLYLSGVYRIIGFTIFGILLLIGGYFLKNETSN